MAAPSRFAVCAARATACGLGSRFKRLFIVQIDMQLLSLFRRDAMPPLNLQSPAPGALESMDRGAISGSSAPSLSAVAGAQQAAILECSLDCIIIADHEGKILEFNPAAEQTFGYRREEVLGKELADAIVPPSLRDAHRQGLARYLATREAHVIGRRIEIRAVRADGTEFPVELAISLVSATEPPLFVAYLRDISERTKAERRLAAEHATTRVLASSSDVAQALPEILGTICRTLEWDLGMCWLDRSHSGALECAEVWRPDARSAGEFEALSRAAVFSAGRGLPGRVWSSGEPAWILDVTKDANFPRAQAAWKEGLHAAFAFPIRGNAGTLGVMEFF